MLPGVLFVWKVPYSYQKVHTKPLFWLYAALLIVECIQSELEIFADDTKTYSVIETIHDIAKLQQDLWNVLHRGS